MPLDTYKPKRTYLVNTINNNHLVRGNQPLNEDGTFAYNQINQKLQTLIPEFDLKNFKLIDVSIIDNNPQSEGNDLASEFLVYGVSKEEFDDLFPFPNAWPPVYRQIDVRKQYGIKVCENPGSVIWYPVQGCSSIDNCELVEHPQFDFSGLVDYLNELISTQEKIVVYYHCEHGHDRTSALTAAYMLKYMNRTLDEVLNNRPPLGAKAFSHDWEVDYKQLVEYYQSKLLKIEGI